MHAEWFRSSAMKKIRVTDLERVMAHKPVGYVEDVISHGTVTDGVLFLEDSDYVQLQDKYRIKSAAPIARPSVAQKMSSASGAATRVVKAKAQGQVVTVSDEERDRRMAICQDCEFFTGLTCLKCGCVARWKTKLATEKCPVGKW
jgi:hypothetical protein